MALLQIDPEARPSSREVLRALGASSRERSEPPKAIVNPLVGRGPEVRALREAYDDARSGQAITVRVSGEAGMGKSQLVRSFLEQLLADGQTNVLSGRAYERESMPYKAVDGVIDSLSQLLVQLDEDLGGRAPRQRLRALARLFPVLDRVTTIEADDDDGPPEDAPLAERRRAFGELRDCLSSLARRRPLVVLIDDVHCGDADSGAHLLEVMRPPRAPPILLLMTSRDDAAEGSPFLAEMTVAWRGELREVRVKPLSATDALELARSLVDPAAPAAERLARAVARESRGYPLLVQELVRSYRNDVGPDGATLVVGTLEQLIATRLGALSPGARALAELVAVAGRPLSLQIFSSAAGIDGEVHEHFNALEAAGLARLGFRGNRETAESVHDRLREGVLAQLSLARVSAHHGALADALGATPDTDREALATHLFGAGRREEGARCAEEAADEASSKLAFDLSVRLLRMALDATPAGPEMQRLRVRLAEALVKAGRASAAADEYGAASKGASGTDRIELERAAAEQLLASGRIDEGRAALKRVMGTMGLTVPQSAIGAILLLVVYQLRLALGGIRIPDRDARQIAREDRIYIDTVRAVANGLSGVDVVLGACMLAKYMLVALDRGDKFDVLRGLCAQSFQRAVIGRVPNRHELRMVDAARALAAQLGGDAGSYVVQMHGLSLYMRGHFRESLETLDTVGRGVPGVLSTVNAKIFALLACTFLGKHQEVARRAPRYVREAEERGDLYTVVCLQSTAMVYVALAADDPAEARRHVREAMSKWSQKGFHAQHWYAMWSTALIDLYDGAPAAAYAHLVRNDRGLRRSMLLRAQFLRAQTLYLRGCCAIASIREEPGARKQRAAEANRLAGQLLRQRANWSPTLGTILRAGALSAAGDRDRAVKALREALEHAEAAELWPQSFGVRYQLGLAIGGDEGRELRAEAARTMRQEAIQAPDRTAATIAPGSWE